MDLRLLKCGCGVDIPLRSSQAGMKVDCPACGNPVEVPSLRRFKELPVAPSPPRPPWFSFLPARTRPRSNWLIGLGGFSLVVAVLTPLLIVLGVLDNALAQTAPGDLRRTLFELNNPALWTGLAALSLSGLVTLIRGLGYPVGGLQRFRGDT